MRAPSLGISTQERAASWRAMSSRSGGIVAAFAVCRPRCSARIQKGIRHFCRHARAHRSSFAATTEGAASEQQQLAFALHSRRDDVVRAILGPQRDRRGRGGFSGRHRIARRTLGRGLERARELYFVLDGELVRSRAGGPVDCRVEKWAERKASKPPIQV